MNFCVFRTLGTNKAESSREGGPVGVVLEDPEHPLSMNFLLPPSNSPHTPTGHRCN